MYELRHQARALGSRSSASSSPHAPPARAAGWHRRTWAARGGAWCCGAQARAHAGVCLSELSGRAVGVSQQRLLSLKDRGRVSSPVPTQASLPVREGAAARLAAAEWQSAQGRAPNLSRSHSTIFSWSFGVCPHCLQAQRGQQHQPCPRTHSPQPAPGRAEQSPGGGTGSCPGCGVCAARPPLRGPPPGPPLGLCTDTDAVSRMQHAGRRQGEAEAFPEGVKHPQPTRALLGGSPCSCLAPSRSPLFFPDPG